MDNSSQVVARKAKANCDFFAILSATTKLWEEEEEKEETDKFLGKVRREAEDWLKLKLSGIWNDWLLQITFSNFWEKTKSNDFDALCKLCLYDIGVSGEKLAAEESEF